MTCTDTNFVDKPPVRRPNTRPTLIYWLIDTRTNQPFYCGKTVNPAHQRLANHKYEAAHGTRKVHARVRDCGESIRLQVMETVPIEISWSAREKHWIYLLRGSFPDNCNTADGGAGTPGRILSAESRAKISAASKRQRHTPEAKAKIVAFLTGRKWKPESIAKMRATKTGKRMSAEVRANQSAAQKTRFAGPDRVELLKKFSRKGAVVSAATRAKLRAAKLGIPRTSEEKAKISASNTGKKMSPEAVAKSAASRTGAKRTPEQRARMSAAHKGKKWSRAQHEAHKGKKWTASQRITIPAANRAAWKRRKEGQGV